MSSNSRRFRHTTRSFGTGSLLGVARSTSRPTLATSVISGNSTSGRTTKRRSVGIVDLIWARVPAFIVSFAPSSVPS